MRVAIVYHFFAHYRSAVMQALLDSRDMYFFLIGDTHDPDKCIKEWTPSPDRLCETRCTRLFGGLLWQHGLFEALRTRSFDVVIFLGDARFVSTWLSALAMRISGKRVLFWTHGWTRKDTGVKRLIRNAFYRLADGLLLYGSRARSIGLSEGFDPSRLYVIFNSLNYHQQRHIREVLTKSDLIETRRTYTGGKDIPVLAFTGRVTRECRLDLLLDAMRILKSRGVSTHLILVGQGLELPSLKKTAEDNHLSVSFIGASYDEHVIGRIIASANIMISPGKIGLAAMHALAYGTPVISHDNPDEQMPEFEAITPGVTGDFFRQGDPYDLANVIEKWISRGWPNEAVRSNCIEIIERYYNPMFQAQRIEGAVKGEHAREVAAGGTVVQE